ncbi:MAG: GNAT family N-acetyltransferase [Anaerolineae bacterium]|nr:GNAT family N-acetyltransferase [Anaerolineae bacterium]
MSIQIHEMTMDFYPQVIALWSATEGVGLSATDDQQNIASYLVRNPGMSFIAQDGEQLVGTVLCGHDGRRGYIHHLAVAGPYRRHGIGKELVTRCLGALKAVEIDKCHLFVFAGNLEAQAFWKSSGWSHRTDLVVMSGYTDKN